MAIDIGTRVGPYEVLATAGSGGMGKVYKAADTRLNRTVAIKILHEFPDEVEVTQRFEREAQAIAALNHPHICTLYDVGRHDGVDYLVMEFIEGQTLAARIEAGPMPVDDVLRYAQQMADALDKAHRRGIVHRDLKPGNVMLTAAGVKLLDFGLAKLRQQPDQGPPTSLSMLPTQNRELTQKGTILGTLQYMSPEQVEGLEADARTDIFALGVVVYEMLTARRAFEGKSHVSLMAAILERDPAPISSVRKISPGLDRVIQVCLAKDPDERWQTAREVSRELKWVAEEKLVVEPKQTGKPRVRLPWIATGVAAAAFLVALVPALLHLLETPSSFGTVRRFVIEPHLMQNPFNFAVSPDGRRLVFSAAGTDDKTAVLWIRLMDSLTPQELPGTERAVAPFWSPDSRFVGFFVEGKLKKIDMLGGLPQTISDAPIAGPTTATWNESDVILYGSNNRGIQRIPAAGGQPTPVTNLDGAKQETGHSFPQFLPDQKHFLFISQSPDATARAVYVASVEDPKPVRLVGASSAVIYAPPGLLIYNREGTLLAQRFDAGRLQVTGDAFPIAEEVSFNIANGRMGVSVSTNGTLVYTTAAPLLIRSELNWYDRSGKPLGRVGNVEAYGPVRLSPDEKQLAYARRDPGRSGDIWLLDLLSGVASRFTVDPADESDPVWSPDGKQLAFHSTRKGQRDLYVKAVGGTNEDLVFASDGPKMPEHWLNDGRLVFRTGLGPGSSINVFSLTGERKAAKLFESPFIKDEVHLSNDGRWVAFNADDSGRHEVYVASFPDFKNLKQVSNAGGGEAFWRKDGRELFYLSLDGKLMTVDINATNGLQTGVPKVLFQTRINVNPQIDQYSPTADGQKFLLVEPIEVPRPQSTPITIVLDWTSALPVVD